MLAFAHTLCLFVHSHEKRVLQKKWSRTTLLTTTSAKLYFTVNWVISKKILKCVNGIDIFAFKVGTSGCNSWSASSGFPDHGGLLVLFLLFWSYAQMIHYPKQRGETTVAGAVYYPTNNL